MPDYQVAQGDEYNSRYGRTATRDSSGRLWVIYYRGTSLYASRSDDGGATWTEEFVGTTDSEVKDCSCAIDSLKNLHVVWNTHTDIKYRKRTTSWQPEETVYVGTYPIGVAQVAVDSLDNIHVAFYEGAGGGYCFRYRKRTTAWQPVEVADNILFYDWNALELSIAIDKDNYVHLAYSATPTHGGYHKIYYCRRLASWGARELVYETLNYSQRYPDIAVDSSSVVHVVWASPTEALRYRQRTSGGWQLVEDFAPAHHFPTIAINQDGHIDVVYWANFGGGVINLVHLKRTTAWGAETIIDLPWIERCPSLIWAYHPKGVQPLAGYTFAYSIGGTPTYIRYYASPDLVWHRSTADYQADMLVLSATEKSYETDMMLALKDVTSDYQADMILFDPQEYKADLIVRRQPGFWNTAFKIQVARAGDASYTDLSARALGFSINESADQKNRALNNLRFSNEAELNSLNPYDKNSPYNLVDGAWRPLLWPGSKIQIHSAVAPWPHEPSLYKLMFDGFVDSIDVGEERGRSTLVVNCLEQARQLQRIGTLEEQRYGSETETRVDIIMQDILNYNLGAGAITLNVIGTPDFKVRWVTKKVGDSVWDILQDLASQAGWDLRFRYFGNESRLTFQDPNRTDDTINVLLNTVQDDVYVEQMQITDAEIRNKIYVPYREFGSNLLKSVTVSDTVSIAQFGERPLRLGEEATLNIDSAAKATNLANMILQDLSQLNSTHVLTLHFEPDIQIHDMIALNDPHAASEEYKYGVGEITWQIEVGTLAKTVVRGTRGRRVGSVADRLLHEMRRFAGGLLRDVQFAGMITGQLDTVAPKAPTSVTLTTRGGVIYIEFIAPTLNEDGTPLQDLDRFRIYWGTSPNINPHNPNSYSGHGDFKGFNLAFVGTAGTLYYFRIVAIDRANNMSLPSQEVSATMPAEAIGGYTDVALVVLPGPF